MNTTVPEISPEAYCDAMFILNDAPKSVVPITVVEMHLFSYLGCILALFKGKPVGDWGYSYAITSDGFPFSAQFENARRALITRGLANVEQDGTLDPQYPELAQELELINSIGSWDERRNCIRAATECAVALPVGSIRYAVEQSPGFSTPLKLGQRHQLLEEEDVTLLYDEFNVINNALGEVTDDLLSPAVIWLSARVLRMEDV